jgi:hypothetical protein
MTLLSIFDGEMMRKDNDLDRNDAERAKRAAKKDNVLHHDDHPDASDHVGEAAGGISGVLTGAAIGSAGGPIGTIIGGLAGAMGGWWAGRAISEAAENFTSEDEEYYRGHYERSPGRLADRKYEDVRPAYAVGHMAARNPDYTQRSFEDVEADLQKGWTSSMRERHGDWTTVRPFARDAYDRSRSSFTGKADAAFERSKDAVGKAWDKTKQGADDLKDRVDGNPASKPGPDATDRRV